MPAFLQGKLDASDVVQQTLIRANQAASEFQGNSEAQEAAWLRQILANQLADELRRYGRDKRDLGRERSLKAAFDDSSTRLAACLPADQSTPSQQAMRMERAVILAEAMARLPQDQRLVVELHHLKGCSLSETATQMERTEAAVAGLLRRGLKTLRSLLAEVGVTR